MPFKQYKYESRKNWGADIDGELSRDQISLGALLRIADAAENMAIRHTELIAQRDRFERDAIRLRDELDIMKRRSAALKGVISRTKREAGHA